MRGLILFSITIIVFCGSCGVFNSPNEEFVRLANGYIDKYLELNPEYATSLGEHRYDHLLTPLSEEHYREVLAFNKSYLDTLSKINVAGLNDTNRIDYDMLVHQIKRSIFNGEEMRYQDWNPFVYNPGGALYGLLARDFAPIETRLPNLKSRLEAVPEMLDEGRKNLNNPPYIHTETAIRQFKGTISFIEQGMDVYLETVNDSLKEMLAPARETAAAALKDYVVWMEDTLLPRSDGDFRLGGQKYHKKLDLSLNTSLKGEELLALAEADLIETQEKLYQAALPLFEKYFPKEAANKRRKEKKYIIKKVLDRMAEDHPDEANIVEKAKETLAECTQFVREHNLVTVPDKPINIIVMPEFARGVAVAFCDSPGALEETGETFYAISPPPADWSDKRIESYFREYNNTMLHDLTIHEAMPGHYLQAAHARNFKAPTKVRAIFGSGTFTEGWATYAEQMMVEQGFGGPELEVQMLKMRLRMIINAIIDQKIHAMGMTEEEAMDLMLNEGFQEDGEASGKWRRACLSSTQLSTYYCGNIEINDIRQAAKEKWGERFNLMDFHDRLLSYGSPPPRLVKEMMEL